VDKEQQHRVKRKQHEVDKKNDFLRDLQKHEEKLKFEKHFQSVN